jgi:hypothetical protein
MNGKRDKMEEALDAFWGNKSKDDIPQTGTVGVAQQVESPQEAYNEYQEEGTTIKEQIESSVDATRDMRPGTMQRPKEKSKNLYDYVYNKKFLVPPTAANLGRSIGYGFDITPIMIDLINESNIDTLFDWEVAKCLFGSGYLKIDH